jgi:hypothetical protein
MRPNPILIAILVAAPATAIGFPFLFSWHQSAHWAPGTVSSRAGAGGIYGTGGVTDWGITCAHCHTKAKGLIDAKVEPPGGWPLKGGLPSYVPGASYTVTVTLIGEHLGLSNPGGPNDNLNGFALTVEDQAGKVQGTFTSDTSPAVSGPGAGCPSTPLAKSGSPATYPNGTTYLYGDCHAVLYLDRLGAVTSWTFSWKAPAAGKGPLTVYYGVVDGDHGGDSSLDDDVKMGTVKLVEGP